MFGETKLWHELKMAPHSIKTINTPTHVRNPIKLSLSLLVLNIFGISDAKVEKSNTWRY